MNISSLYHHYLHFITFVLTMTFSATKIRDSPSNSKFIATPLIAYDQNIRPLESSENGLWNLLQKIFNACDATSIAIIVDEPHYETLLLKLMSVSGLPFVRYHGDDDKAGPYSFQRMNVFLRGVYSDYGIEHYVIAAHDPGRVLRVLESVFTHESYGELALFPHRTKWIVIAWTERQWGLVVDQQIHSVLDNVAMMKVNTISIYPLSQEIVNVVTFMWKANRARWPDEVKLTSLMNIGDEKMCHSFFPNTQFGLNGRNLLAGPKIFLKVFLDLVSPHAQGKREFKGIFIDVLNYSSESSNFTYALQSNSRVFSYGHIGWDEYSYFLNNGSMDIGLSTWSTLFQVAYNFSFSYPVAFDTILGIYRRPQREVIYDSLVFICPFAPLNYLVILACAIYTSALYTVIVRYVYPSEKSDKIMKNKRYCDGRTYPEARGGNKTNIELSRLPSVNGKPILRYHVSIITKFLLALLNQSYMPRPRQMSARLVVGVWAIGIVILCAIFSSSITAEMVNPKQSLPFDTFKELLDRSDYRCTALAETIVAFSLRNAKTGMLAKLWTKTKVISLSYSAHHAIDHGLSAYLGNLPRNTVFIHYESAIKTWLRNNANAEDYVIMEKDPLFNSDISIVFPYKSELNELISKDIVKLYESGILFKQLKSHSAIYRPNRRSGLPIRTVHRIVKIHHLFWLSVTCFICVVAAFLVLCAETLIHNSHNNADSYFSKVKRVINKKLGKIYPPNQ